MPIERLDLGGTPYEEDCASIGVTENAQRYNQLECRAYILALKRKYGEPPEGCRFSVYANPHDFGTYYNVRLAYTYEVPRQREYADKVEHEIARWSDVNFWRPVTYQKSQPVHVIEDLTKLDRDVNKLGVSKDGRDIFLYQTEEEARPAS